MILCPPAPIDWSVPGSGAAYISSYGGNGYSHTSAGKAGANAPYCELTHTLDEWERRKIEGSRLLLGNVLTTTTRAMLSADTGLGKTHLAHAIGFAMAAGKPFCHWRGHERARVLIVDGEMSRELLGERLNDAERRLGERPPALSCLSQEDAEAMPPLDTKEGQEWLDGFIDYLAGIDFLILDNIMSLTTGDMKDETAWRTVADWNRRLTKRGIGVLWINHTGHDATRAYGTKTREWQLDTVITCERYSDKSADIAFRLTFSKARQRKPRDRDDFETVIIRLIDGQWTSETALLSKKKRAPPGAALAQSTLSEAIKEKGQPVPDHDQTKGVTLDQWRDKFYKRCPLDVESKDDDQETKKAREARKKKFQRTRDYLQEQGWIDIADEFCWPRRQRDERDERDNRPARPPS